MRSMVEWTLSEWANAAWKTYRHFDEKRSLMDMFGSLVIYSSKVAEGLRKARYDEVFRGLAHMFVWIASIAGKLEYDTEVPEILKPFDKTLEEIIALNYPNKCPRCLSCVCICSLRRKELENTSDKANMVESLLQERKEFKETEKYSTWSVDRWVKMFSIIYREPVANTPADIIGFHLSEEVGESVNALRDLQHLLGAHSVIDANKRTKEARNASKELKKLKERRYEFQIELAQVFSWMCSLYLRITTIFDGLNRPSEVRKVGNSPRTTVQDVIVKLKDSDDRPLRFSDLLVHRFMNRQGEFICDDCGQAKCACSIYPK